MSGYVDFGGKFFAFSLKSVRRIAKSHVLLCKRALNGLQNVSFYIVSK